MKFVTLTTLILAFTLNACTSVKLVLPNPRVEVPELRGTRGLKIEANIEGAHEYTLSNNANQRPPDVDHPTTDKTHTLNA